MARGPRGAGSTRAHRDRARSCRAFRGVPKQGFLDGYAAPEMGVPAPRRVRGHRERARAAAQSLRGHAEGRPVSRVAEDRKENGR